ncbi:MAG: peptidase M61 [Cytophagales bacterium]|nr:peptidase M61 [Cytophagales bacterium]
MGVLGIPLFSLYGQVYRAELNLNEVQDDQLRVRLYPPPLLEEEVEFHMPRIVPGTYSVYDFGRFLNNFEALDSLGQKLPSIKLDSNRWQIKNASRLHQITYWVEDTYDSSKDNVVFEPAGTSIEEDKVFVINPHGFFGYLKGSKHLPYEISFQRPENFYGSTSLRRIKHKDENASSSEDIFRADNYIDLVDNPILYCKPDTASIWLGDTKVLSSVYSPNDRIDARFIAEHIKEVLKAQESYLGGVLPVDRYAFLIYLMDKTPLSGALGALEHAYSSFYSLPEQMNDPISLAQLVKDVAAHEFFHILTPLTIHSEEIGNFDFIQPEMSKHLWLYEGVTEYFATHVQLQHNLMDKDLFVSKILDKIRNMHYTYNDSVSFTDLSKGCLDVHKEEYGNVYEKGALIGLCLDVELLRLSNGRMNLMDLMLKLSKIYGKDRPFKDDELFDQISKITYPEIKDFLLTHVENNTPLPLERIFKQIGIRYTPPKNKELWSLGKEIPVQAGAFAEIRKNTDDDKGEEVYAWLPIHQQRAMTKKEFNETIILLHKINGYKVSEASPETLIDLWDKTKKPGDKVLCRLSLIRKKEGAKGYSRKTRWKRLRLHRIEGTQEPSLSFLKEPDPSQKDLYELWFKK